VVGLRELRSAAILSLRRCEFATAEVAINGMLVELQKVPNELVSKWCHGVVRLFKDADFERVADIIEREFPVKLVTQE
jgi:hypothetical protein